MSGCESASADGLPGCLYPRFAKLGSLAAMSARLADILLISYPLSFLHYPAETDNCACALWASSFARASLLLRSAHCCFACPAKNIL